MQRGVEQKEKRSGLWILFHPLATNSTAFLVCHPTYNDCVMLKMVRHAIHSSLSTQSAAAFLLLPNWKGLDVNAYMQILKEHPECCTILGTAPQASVTYRRQDFWIGTMQALLLLNGFLIIILWNGSTVHAV